MHGPFLADLSTLIWVIVVSVMFVVLAHWSTGESWGISSAVVDGVRGWAHDLQGRGRAMSSGGDLPLMRLDAGSMTLASAAAPPPQPLPMAEIVELGTRRTDR